LGVSWSASDRSIEGGNRVRRTPKPEHGDADRLKYLGVIWRKGCGQLKFAERFCVAIVQLQPARACGMKRGMSKPPAQSSGGDITGPAGIALGCDRTNIGQYGVRHLCRP
jgi:hypothetical protein